MRDAYVFTFNRFSSAASGATNIGNGILILESPKLASGQGGYQFATWTSNTDWVMRGSTILPGGTDLAGNAQPPAGSFMPLLSLGVDKLYLIKLVWNWSTRTVGINGVTGQFSLTPAAYTELCINEGRDCIPQQGTTQKLDGIGRRLMNRLVYNYFGTYDTVRSLPSP